jgi:hypothetical protein
MRGLPSTLLIKNGVNTSRRHDRRQQHKCADLVLRRVENTNVKPLRKS